MTDYTPITKHDDAAADALSGLATALKEAALADATTKIKQQGQQELARSLSLFIDKEAKLKPTEVRQELTKLSVQIREQWAAILENQQESDKIPF